MFESAALLVEHRLPAVPWRQSVLSFEGPMAVRPGCDKRSLALVCQRFAKRVQQTLRLAFARRDGVADVESTKTGLIGP